VIESVVLSVIPFHLVHPSVITATDEFNTILVLLLTMFVQTNTAAATSSGYLPAHLRTAGDNPSSGYTPPYLRAAGSNGASLPDNLLLTCMELILPRNQNTAMLREDLFLLQGIRMRPIVAVPLVEEGPQRPFLFFHGSFMKLGSRTRLVAIQKHCTKKNNFSDSLNFPAINSASSISSTYASSPPIRHPAPYVPPSNKSHNINPHHTHYT
jgi:hypothetical protein